MSWLDSPNQSLLLADDPAREGSGGDGVQCHNRHRAPVLAVPCPRPPCMTLGCRDHRHVALGATSRAVPVVSPPLHDPTVSHHRGVACVLEIKPAGANAASTRAHCGAMGRTGGCVPTGVH